VGRKNSTLLAQDLREASSKEAQGEGRGASRRMARGGGKGAFGQLGERLRGPRIKSRYCELKYTKTQEWNQTKKTPMTQQTRGVSPTEALKKKPGCRRGNSDSTIK